MRKKSSAVDFKNTFCGRLHTACFDVLKDARHMEAEW